METKERSRHEIMREIEQKHLGRCFDQTWGSGRRNLIELMEVRDTNKNVIVVKQFESRVPTRYDRDWPELAGVWVYVPIEEGTNTWQELDEKLSEFREANKLSPIK